MKGSSETRLERILRTTVREKMESKGITLRGLARDAGVPLGTLHNWLGSTAENKKNDGRPRFAVVVAVAVFLGIKLDAVVKAWQGAA